MKRLNLNQSNRTRHIKWLQPIKQVSFLAVLPLLAPLSIQAEEVRIPVGHQTNEAQARIQMPGRGMNKNQVEAQFGSPDSRHGPNGTPAIYYWEYPDYTVYFESDYVIHSVLKNLQAR